VPMKFANSMTLPSLKERLRELAEELRARADSIEREGSVPVEVVSELKSSGLFRAFVPKRYGGWEAEYLPVVESLAFLGEGCASTCWVASLFVSHGLIAAWFSESAQDAIWSNGPDALVGSSLAPMGKLREADGGYTLSGDWSYSSGVDHADWLILGAKDEGQSLLVLVPASEAKVRDDWEVCGLQGTGSRSVSLQEVFVPLERSLSMGAVEGGETPGHRVNRGGIFRYPWRAAFSFSFVPTALGIARSAIALSRSHFAEKCSAYTGKKFADNPVGWLQLAESAGELEAAWAVVRRNLSELDALVREGRSVPDEVVIRSCYAPAQAVVLCRLAVERLFHKSGAWALLEKNALQRNFRDIQAVGQHPGVNIDIAGQAYGKALLDRPELRVGE